MPRMGETATEQVIRTVAETTGTDPLELPPLYGTIDPDALDALVEDMAAGTISFSYVGREITVNSDGTVMVEDLPTDEPTSAAYGTDD